MYAGTHRSQMTSDISGWRLSRGTQVLPCEEQHELFCTVRQSPVFVYFETWSQSLTLSQAGLELEASLPLAEVMQDLLR